MNIVILSGNLTNNVDVYTNKSGIIVVKGVVAVKREYSKKDETDFIPFTVLGNSTDYVAKYGKKGVGVVIEGYWQHNSFKNDKGEYKTFDTCVVNRIKLLLEKPTEKKQVESGASVGQPSNDLDIGDDDLPF